jgi:hypothetical protein
MVLSAFGVQVDQQELAAEVKPDREDTNVTPEEIGELLRSHGLQALVRYGGGTDIVRGLVRSGVPVLAEQWIDVEGRGQMGHYRVVVGYDDVAAEFTVQDSYYGPRRRYSYDEFERMWRPFVGAYVVAFTPQQRSAVEAALGADMDETAMWARVLAETAQRAVAAPDDPWAWFALGEARSRVADYSGAVEAFDRARSIGLPFRAFWYQFGLYRSLIELGSYERVIELADETLATMNGENLEESHYWRGMALERLGRVDEARASYEAALAFNRLFEPAREALDRLP